MGSRGLFSGVGGTENLRRIATTSAGDLLTDKSSLSLFIKCLSEGNHSQGEPQAMLEGTALLARVAASLVGISRWISYRRGDETLPPELKDAWPHIWRWSSRLLGAQIDSEILETVKNSVLTIIFNAGRDAEFLAMMASTTGTLATIARIWEAEINRPPHVPSVVSEEIQPVSHVLHLFMIAGHPSWCEQVQRALGGAEKTARLALESIRGRASTEIIDFGPLLSNLASFMVFIEYLPETRGIFFSKRAFRFITEVMIRLLATQQSLQEGAGPALIVCVGYMIIGLQFENGRHWAHKMYDAPILQAIIQGSLWRKKEEAFLESALDTITPYLVFRSILHCAERACETIDELGLMKKLKKDGLVYKSLERYRSLVDERLKSDGRHFGTKICGSGPCSRMGNSKQFLRCGGCLQVYYCNKTCQRESWKYENHRKMCKMDTEDSSLRDGRGESRLLPEDYKLVEKIVMIDASTNLERISKLAREVLSSKPETPPHLITPVLDYSETSLKISLETDPLGTIRSNWGEKTILSTYERLKNGSPGMVVRAILPFGATRYPCEILLVEKS